VTLIQSATQDGRIPPLINVEAVRRNGVLTIGLSGELDCATQTATRRALDDGLAGHLPPSMIVDLTRLDFCDCAGARVLKDLQRAVEEREISCVFKNPQPQVRWVLRAAAGIASFLVMGTDGLEGAPPGVAAPGRACRRDGTTR
jgi:anti-sigma B factor antagonist